MDTAVEFKDVDILFTSEPSQRRGAAQIRTALAALDKGESRARIAEQLGVVVGVAGANLKVGRGEICVLMGLSGSGKSTLMRAANGLNTVTRGHVFVRDGDRTVDVADCNATALRGLRRRRIAMVFQQFGLLPWRTVRENVGLGLELRGESSADRRRIVAEKLELVGLSQWAERQVAELSGGMQQRVGLARAFATDADILLMDEPFSALDPLIRTKLQDELLALQERVKKTILFVSHDLDEALRLGDQISILEGGRIIQTGTAQDIVMAPATDYVAEFVRHMNPLSVLTGSMVMRAQAGLTDEAGHLWLDVQQRYRLELDDQRQPVTVQVGGSRLFVHRCEEDCDPAKVPAGVAMVPGAISLQGIIRLHEATGHPVLLSEQGALIGVCGEAEIIRALAGRSRSAA
jgi:glycine betaine/proline transport system ATP-binding protein